MKRFNASSQFLCSSEDFLISTIIHNDVELSLKKIANCQQLRCSRLIYARFKNEAHKDFCMLFMWIMCVGLNERVSEIGVEV